MFGLIHFACKLSLTHHYNGHQVIQIVGFPIYHMWLPMHTIRMVHLSRLSGRVFNYPMWLPVHTVITVPLSRLNGIVLYSSIFWFMPNSHLNLYPLFIS